MSKSWIFFFVVFLSSHLVAQEVLRVPARFQSMGDASVSIQSPLSIFSNPAGFAREHKLSFGINYEKRFLLNELQTSSAFLILPVQRTTFGFAYSQFGRDDFQEGEFAFGIAKKLYERLDAALQFHYFNLYFPENERGVGTLVFDIGAQYQVKNDFRLGAQVFNPRPFSMQDISVELKYPAIYRLGIQKTFNDLLFLAVEARKESQLSPGLNFGLELKIKEQVQLRIGIQSHLSIFSLGVGYTIKQLQTDVSFQYHQYLGYSPAFTIYYQMP